MTTLDIKNLTTNEMVELKENLEKEIAFREDIGKEIKQQEEIQKWSNSFEDYENTLLHETHMFDQLETENIKLKKDLEFWKDSHNCESVFYDTEIALKKQMKIDDLKREIFKLKEENEKLKKKNNLIN